MDSLWYCMIAISCFPCMANSLSLNSLLDSQLAIKSIACCTRPITIKPKLWQYLAGGAHCAVMHCAVQVLAGEVCYMFDMTVTDSTASETIRGVVKHVMEKPGILKITHDCGYLAAALQKQISSGLCSVFDTQVNFVHVLNIFSLCFAKPTAPCHMWPVCKHLSNSFQSGGHFYALISQCSDHGTVYGFARHAQAKQSCTATLKFLPQEVSVMLIICLSPEAMCCEL